MPAHSFKTRLKAWWEGYDLPQQVKPTGTGSDRPRLQLPCPDGPDAETRRLVFGAGRTLPIAEDLLTGIPPECALNAQSALLVGIEAGAPVAAMATDWPDLRITALDPDAEARKLTEEAIRTAAPNARVSVGPVDLDKIELSENSYDLIVTRLALQSLGDRGALYRKLERALRRNGALALTQMVAADDSSPEEVAMHLQSSLEPDPPSLLTFTDEQRLLVESGLKADLVEDVSDDAAERTRSCFERWRDIVDTLQDYRDQPRMLQTLLAETERWQKRLHLIDQGQLQIVRFIVEKRRNELTG